MARQFGMAGQFVFLVLVCAVAFGHGATYDFEMACQPPTRWIRVMHVQDVSPDMTPYIENGLLGGAVEGFDDWMHDTFSSGATSGIVRFTNKEDVTSNPADMCAETVRPLSSSPLLADYQSMTINVGLGSPKRSVMDAAFAAARTNWDVPTNAGRQIVFVYTSQEAQMNPTPGFPAFDGSLDCENVDYPGSSDLEAEYNNMYRFIVFVVPPSMVSVYESWLAGWNFNAVVVPLSDNPATLMDSMFSAIDWIYCGVSPPTPRPPTASPDTSSMNTETPCTEDAILQLLHLQDVSWSYTNDLANMKAKFPDLLSDLEAKFYRREVGVVTFSDKPRAPVGYWGDHCYREISPFETNESIIIDALDGVKILSGRDWKESQYDAMLDGAESASLGWSLVNEVDGHQVLKVMLLATDAGPHVRGDLDSLPDSSVDGCRYRDYPTPAGLGSVLDAANIYPIFVVTSDLYNYWVNKAAQVTPNAVVLHLSQPSEDVFAAIENALEDICQTDRRRRLKLVTQ